MEAKGMLEDSHVGFVGGGNMGEALIRGLLAASLLTSDRLHVYDVVGSRVEYLANRYQVQAAPSIGDLTGACHLIVLAVKPQNMPAALEELKRQLTHEVLIISIAAGISAFASFIAGTLGVVGLMLIAPPLAEMALKFGPPEYFALM
ncbi:MAG: NAD(P)-binding domain-containing protein, partial [Syntrophobacteraceae bacterium]|nr:NAD(P)-binding domain-containing protein [Syntrophobacteraceae bacterium]